jgi:hypothetical protein
MPPEHTGPGIAHHDFDLVAALAFVAMHWAVGTSRLSSAKPATFQSQRSVLEQIMAFATKRAGSSMVATAVTLNHCRDRGPFAFQSAFR